MALFLCLREEVDVSAVTRTPWVTFGCFGTLVECPAASGVIRPMADVEPMLAQLRARRYRLGVLTNCSDREFEVVEPEDRR